jgi:predicted esterase
MALLKGLKVEDLLLQLARDRFIALGLGFSQGGFVSLELFRNTRHRETSLEPW